MSRLSAYLCPPNGVEEDRRFLLVVLSQSIGLEDGYRLLQTSKRLLWGWKMLILREAEKFATWPLLTLNVTSHTQYICAHASKDSKRLNLGLEMLFFRGAKNLPLATWTCSCSSLRIKLLNFHTILILFRHFSMVFNTAQLVYNHLTLLTSWTELSDITKFKVIFCPLSLSI